MKLGRPIVSVSLAVLLLGCLSASAAGMAERPAGSRILLASNRDGTTRTYSVLPDGSRLTPLLPGGRELAPVAVSRDGSTVAYKPVAYKDGETLYVSRADGSGLHRVVKTEGSASLSRDGKMLAFADARGISIIRTDGHGGRRLTRAVGVPDWSPDGKALLFASGEGKRAAVVVQPLNGPRRVVVRAGDVEFGTPKWSPDGRWIAYERSGGLWTVRPNGTNRHRVYPTCCADRELAWSPDSRRLAFIVFDRHRQTLDIAVARVDGRGAHELHLDVKPGAPAGLTWSPDGSRLALGAYGAGDPEQIWLVGADGRGLRRLTEAGTNMPLGWTRLAPRLSPAHQLPPSERVLDATTVVTQAPVGGLSADGTRVAFISHESATDCAHVTVWTPAQKSLVRVSPRLPAPCGENDEGGMQGVQLAGSRVAWTWTSGCGNYCYYVLQSATLTAGSPVAVGHDVPDPYEDPNFALHGDGDLLVFNEGSRLVRIGSGRERCSSPSDWAPSMASICSTLRRDTHAAPVDSVSGELIAIRERDAVAVVDAKGALVRVFPFLRDDVSAARLDAGRLLVARLGVLESYDVATGSLGISRPLPSGYRLTDFDGGVAVLQSESAIMLLRLSDGRSYTLPNHARLAELEPPGLYYSYTSGKEGRIVFVPRAEVERLLGS